MDPIDLVATVKVETNSRNQFSKSTLTAQTDVTIATMLLFDAKSQIGPLVRLQVRPRPSPTELQDMYEMQFQKQLWKTYKQKMLDRLVKEQTQDPNMTQEKQRQALKSQRRHVGWKV